MSKPPTSPPSSDLDGVDRDEVSNIDAAIEADQDSGDIERARREARARPAGHKDPKADRDDRSR